MNVKNLLAIRHLALSTRIIIECQGSLGINFRTFRVSLFRAVNY